MSIAELDTRPTSRRRDPAPEDFAIEIEGVTKVFARDPGPALEAIRQGRSKTEIQAEANAVVGLRDVSLSVRQGEVFVVMGLSGSGKSTLIRHVNRLIEPTAGRIRVHGDDVLGMSRDELRAFRRTRIAMVFQKFGLLPHRSVIDNVAYGLEIRGVKKAERYEAARGWIERVGLAGYENSRPRQLSGGQQQRVGLARALAMDTDVLLMDEAFSALDPLIRAGMQDELLALQKTLNKTILFITHDFDEAIKIGDRIAILSDGEIEQIGRPDEIILRPATEHVGEFVRAVNKARVIRVRAIMERGEYEPCALAVPDSTSCDGVLPLFAEHDWIGVTDSRGRQIGRLTVRHVIKALAEHAPKA